MAEQKLDVFRTLSAMDARKSLFFVELEAEEQKAYQPLVVMKWAVGCSDDWQTIKINEYLNPYVFSLSSHKELLWKLSVASSTGKKHHYHWNKTLTNDKNPVTIQLICEYFEYSEKDAQDMIPLLSHNDLIDIAMSLGYTADIITKLKKELK